MLDLGFRAGMIAAAIRAQRRVEEIWGVEVVPEVAEQARANPALDRVLCGDISSLIDRLPSGAFRDGSTHVAVDPLDFIARILAHVRAREALTGQAVARDPPVLDGQQHKRW